MSSASIYPRDPILRLKDVIALVSLSKSTIYAGVQEGTFPAPVRLGRRAVGWLLSTLQAWIDARKSAR
ncbi:MAG: AlpA family phage regulatory protein [Burkholderiaceae bacterium]|nr:AlpA family phage regulatory protein [Burkholderiaceae bacterium]